MRGLGDKGSSSSTKATLRVSKSSDLFTWTSFQWLDCVAISFKMLQPTAWGYPHLFLRSWAGSLPNQGGYQDGVKARTLQWVPPMTRLHFISLGSVQEGGWEVPHSVRDAKMVSMWALPLSQQHCRDTAVMTPDPLRSGTASLTALSIWYYLWKTSQTMPHPPALLYYSAGMYTLKSRLDVFFLSCVSQKAGKAAVKANIWKRYVQNQILTSAGPHTAFSRQVVGDWAPFLLAFPPTPAGLSGWGLCRISRLPMAGTGWWTPTIITKLWLMWKLPWRISGRKINLISFW